MKNKNKNNLVYPPFFHNTNMPKGGRFYHLAKKFAAVISIVVIVFVFGQYSPIQKAEAAGINTITTTLVNSTAVSTESQITVVFSPTTAVIVNDTISVYIGEISTEDPWVDTDTTVDFNDVTCAGTGYTFDTYTQTDATSTSPLRVTCDVLTLTTGTNAITVTIGTSSTDSLYNPAGADIYTVSVVTNDDSGAGLTYVGDANRVTVSTTVLPTLAMLLDNPDGTNCTGTPVVTCNLGVTTTAAVSTGSYDVNAGSNSTGNITISIAETGDLGTIDDVVNDTIVTGDGVEEYGVGVSDDGAEWTPQGNYAVNDTPIVTGPTAFYLSTGPASEAGQDITVVHRVSVATDTAYGAHSHTVIYTAAASF